MSNKKPLACIILAAGQGSRMKSSLPKVLHKLAGRPLIGWLLESLAPLSPEKIITVISPNGQDVAQAAAPHGTIIQEKPLGTGDAVRAALPALENFDGDVLILLGDMPLISTQTLQDLITARHNGDKTGLSVLGVEFDMPPAFGRLVLDTDGTLSKIVEDKDCSAKERNIKLCNSGAFCVNGKKLAEWVGQIENNNAASEFYITDLIEIAVKDEALAQVHITSDTNEVRGVNSRSDLAELEAIIQNDLRHKAMENGATLIDPASVYFSWDTITGQDVVIEPNVFFGTGVEIADNTKINAFSHLEETTIGKGAAIGPFARIRPKSKIDDYVTVGNFIEVNRSHMKEGSKAKHMCYLGDAVIGKKTNIGAGTVIANYDGFTKHETIIGDHAFIGTNTTLVAPIEIGEGALVAAGSAITKNVPPDALAVAREKPLIIEGWAAKRRKKKA